MTPGRMSAADRRQDLLAAARRLFLDGGYRGTTTLAVAEAGGVSEALLLKHFGTKQALFREAMAEPVVTMLQEAVAANWERVVSGSFDTVADHLVRLREFGVGWAGLIREHGPLLLALLRESNDFPDVAAQVGEMVAAVVDQVAGSLAALTAGEEYVDFDARVATYAGLAAMGVAAVAGPDIDSYMDKFVTMLMFGLLSPTGRQRSGAERVVARSASG